MCSDGSGDALADLEAVLDRLAAEDLKAMFGPQLLDRTRRLLRAQNRLAAHTARAVHEGQLTQAPEHDGLATMQSWLRGHGRLSPAAAHRLVGAGRALEHLPAVSEAFADGRITADQVAVIATVTRDEHRAAADEQGVDLAVVDETLADVAATRPYSELGQVVHHYLERLDPDGPEPDPTEQRSLILLKHPDGSVSGRFELDAVGGEKAQAALESILQANRPAGDTRTRSQQLGDAFVQLADNALAAGSLPFLRTARDRRDPAGRLRRPCHRSRRGRDRLRCPHLRRARPLAGLRRQHQPHRRRPEGQPLDVGRTKRVVPPHIRRAVEVRDRHCVFAGCHAPTHWCDIHRVLEWVLDDGPTSVENGALLCERHHTKVHHGFRVERQPDGRWRTWRPDGTEIVQHPHLLTA